MTKLKMQFIGKLHRTFIDLYTIFSANRTNEDQKTHFQIRYNWSHDMEKEKGSALGVESI